MDLSENDASHFIPEEPPPDGGHDEGQVAVEPLQRRGDGEVDAEQHPVGRTLQAKSRYSRASRIMALRLGLAILAEFSCMIRENHEHGGLPTIKCGLVRSMSLITAI